MKFSSALLVQLLGLVSVVLSAPANLHKPSLRSHRSASRSLARRDLSDPVSSYDLPDLFEKRSVAPAPPSPYRIKYGGGSLMTDPIKVHVIYYGKFATSSKALLNDFLLNLQNSKWWALTKKYKDSKGKSVGAYITAGDVFNVPAGNKTLSESDVLNLVIKTVKKPISKNDIHVVLSDRTVNQVWDDGSAICTDFLGWHDGKFAKSDPYTLIKFAYVNSPLYCIDNDISSGLLLSYNVTEAGVVTTNAPNNDYEMDSIIDVLAHELTETATDPDVSGEVDGTFPGWWHDDKGPRQESENADVCVSYGKIYESKGPKGTDIYWNEKVGQKKYFIQQNLDLDTNTCANGGI